MMFFASLTFAGRLARELNIKRFRTNNPEPFCVLPVNERPLIFHSSKHDRQLIHDLIMRQVVNTENRAIGHY